VEHPVRKCPWISRHVQQGGVTKSRELWNMESRFATVFQNSKNPKMTAIVSLPLAPCSLLSHRQQLATPPPKLCRLRKLHRFNLNFPSNQIGRDDIVEGDGYAARLVGETNGSPNSAAYSTRFATSRKTELLVIG
jgi:hypothetical protein